MTLPISRRGGIDPFIVMEVMRAARVAEAAGVDVIHLEVGQPGTPAPAGARAAVRAALDRETLGYTGEFGTDALRAGIAAHYRATCGIEVPIERIAATMGSSAGFILAFLAAFDAGDRVALARPGYSAYRNVLRALDLVPVEIETAPEDGFQPTVAQLAALDPPVQGLIVASPANPTGTMLSRARLQDLVDWCAARRVRLVSDEIYHGICFAGAATSAAELTDRAIIVNSFSKYFSMTGWRLGWLVLPPDLLHNAACLAQNLFISPPAISQVAGLAALSCRAELDGNVAVYAENRRILLEGLPGAGFTRFAPADGAFYLYADISDWQMDSRAFCQRLLAEAGVAATPGVDFDPVRGQRYVRFSFAGPSADMHEAVRRLTAWHAVACAFPSASV